MYYIFFSFHRFFVPFISFIFVVWVCIFFGDLWAVDEINAYYHQARLLVLFLPLTTFQPSWILCGAKCSFGLFIYLLVLFFSSLLFPVWSSFFSVYFACIFFVCYNSGWANHCKNCSYLQVFVPSYLDTRFFVLLNGFTRNEKLLS